MLNKTSLIHCLLPWVSRHRWLTALALVFMVGLMVFAVSWMVSSRLPKTNPNLFLGRNFEYTPFELTDAYEVCLAGTQSEHRDDLLRYHMDNLSTRFDHKTDTYLVVLRADIGDAYQYSEVLVYCNVDPDSYQLTYYKEQSPDEKSILSRTLSIFNAMRGK